MQYLHMNIQEIFWITIAVEHTTVQEDTWHIYDNACNMHLRCHLATFVFYLPIFENVMYFVQKIHHTKSKAEQPEVPHTLSWAPASLRQSPWAPNTWNLRWAAKQSHHWHRQDLTEHLQPQSTQQTALCKAASALLEAEHEAPGFVFSLLWSLTHYKSKGRPGCPSCTHTPPNPTPDSRKHCSQAHINSTQAFNPTWHICEQFKLTQQHLRHSKTLEIR